MRSKHKLKGRELEREVRELRTWLPDRDIELMLGETAGMLSAWIGGATLADIAERRGYTRQAISHRFRVARVAPGLRSRNDRERRLSALVYWCGDEIRRKWASGVSAPSIAREYGISSTDLGGIVEKVVRDSDRRSRAVARGLGGPRTRAKAIPDSAEGLRRAVACLLLAQARNGGETPSCARYAEIAREHDDLPSLPTLTAHVRYSQIQAVAGHPARAKAGRSRVSVAACWRALRLVADESGRPGMPPTIRGYSSARAGRDHLPSASVIRRRIGGWSAIYAEWPGPSAT